MTSVLAEIDLLSPFLRSTQEIFETMLCCRCRFADAVSHLDELPADSVTACIRLSGRLDGILTIGFSSQTCIRILERMTEMEVDSVDDMVCDA